MQNKFFPSALLKDWQQQNHTLKMPCFNFLRRVAQPRAQSALCGRQAMLAEPRHCWSGRSHRRHLAMCRSEDALKDQSRRSSY